MIAVTFHDLRCYPSATSVRFWQKQRVHVDRTPRLRAVIGDYTPNQQTSAGPTTLQGRSRKHVRSTARRLRAAIHNEVILLHRRLECALPVLLERRLCRNAASFGATPRDHLFLALVHAI